MREFTDISQLAPTDIRDLQMAELRNLLVLDEVCRENGIRYFLGGGTCIGALRHQGFVPWDDDVDVWIPRPDYERLHEIWDEACPDPHFHLRRNNERECYHINCSFVKDERGTFINRHSANEDIDHGIPIDVMAMDAAPSNPFARLDQIVLAMLQSIFISQRKPDHQGKAIRFLTRIPLALVRSRHRRYRIWKWCERRMTRWAWEDCDKAVELTTGFKMKFKSMPKEWFDTTKPAVFEGHKLQIAQGAEHYMELLFGDYMQLPPESERCAKHVVYVNLDEGYESFRGVRYLTDPPIANNAL